MLHANMNGSSEATERPTGEHPDRPIFIVGTGRSGSTVFHRILAEHPDLAWQSPLCDVFPSRPGWNRALLATLGVPVIGRALDRYLQPGERYKYWEHLCPGFSQPCRDLLATDVTVSVKCRTPPAVAKLATSHRRRILVKITGWPRVGYLRELFPDAKFIHVYRDGRGVANSLLAVGFWRGWQGPTGWRTGELAPAERAEWEHHGKSFVALAGIQWKMLMAAMDQAVGQLPAESVLQIRYEDLVANPIPCFHDVARFCGLDWSREFELSITRHRLGSTNDKWREELTGAQQMILESVLADALRRYGYGSPAEAAAVR